MVANLTVGVVVRVLAECVMVARGCIWGFGAVVVMLGWVRLVVGVRDDEKWGFGVGEDGDGVVRMVMMIILWLRFVLGMVLDCGGLILCYRGMRLVFSGEVW